MLPVKPLRRLSRSQVERVRSCWPALSLLATSLLGSVIHGSAAEAAETSSAAAPEASSGVQEVIVTARKRSESIQDVPASITAFSTEQLQHSDLSSIEKISAATPQLIVARAATGSGAQISLRGIGANFTTISIEQSVAVIVDGAYYGQGRTINEGLFDLGHLELLKGPQALFFGKNATAGVISLNTADPGDKFEAMGRVGYEIEAREVVGEAVISGPLTDTLGIRISARLSDMFGGYFRNGAVPGTDTTRDSATGATHAYAVLPASGNQPGETQPLGRVTLKWQPTDGLTNTLKAYGSRSHYNAASWNVVPLCAGPTMFNNPALSCRRQFTIYQQNLPQAFLSSVRDARNGDTYNNYTSYAFNDTLSYELSHVSLTSVTNFQRNENDLLADYSYESTSSSFSSESSTWRAFSNETRALTTFDFPVNFLAGVYYQTSRRGYHQTNRFGHVENSAAVPGYDRYTAVAKDSYTGGKTLSGFGQGVWKIVPELELAAGARYVHETKDSFYIQPYANPLLVTATAGVPISADQTFNNVSPEATLTWKPVSDITLYSAYKTGYKSGGFANDNLYSPSSQRSDFLFQPEKAHGFEGGIKSVSLDHQLLANLTVYHYTYDGLQVDYFDPQRITYVTFNAGSSKLQGVELDTEFAPRAAAGLTFRGTANYNKSTYDHFIGPCYGGQSKPEGCVFSDLQMTPAAAGQFAKFQNLGGKPTADAPLWTASLGAAYEGAINGGLMWNVSTDVRYSDDYVASAFNSPVAYQPVYFNVDAAARVHTSDNQWELAVLGRNLTNRFVVTGSYDIAFTGAKTGGPTPGRLSDVAGSIALPRTVELQVTWRH